MTSAFDWKEAAKWREHVTVAGTVLSDGPEPAYLYVCGLKTTKKNIYKKKKLEK